MRRFLTSLAVLAFLLAGAPLAYAQSSATSSASALSQVSYPVAALGNCGSQGECKAYCDIAANQDACLAYAQSTGLMSKEKVAAAKLILGKKGPGQCDSKDSCIAYCADSSHAVECLSFATSTQILSSDKAQLIEKFIGGYGPGACKSAQSCSSYCQDPMHAGECRAFAQENGLMPAFGSSTPKWDEASSTPRMGEAHLSSSTPHIASSTMPHPGDHPAGSTTAPRPPLPPKASANNNLGASVFAAFARLLGF